MKIVICGSNTERDSLGAQGWWLARFEGRVHPFAAGRTPAEAFGYFVWQNLREELGITLEVIEETPPPSPPAPPTGWLTGLWRRIFGG